MPRRLLRSARLVAFIGLAVMVAPLAQAATSFQYVLSPDNRKLPAATQIEIAKFFRATEQLLPPSLKEQIGEAVQVKFARYDERLAIETHCQADLAAGQKIRNQVYGRYQGRFLRRTHVIELNQAFLSQIVGGPVTSRQYPCGHRSVYQLAMATLAHETGHVYDQLNWPKDKDPVERAARAQCDFQRANEETPDCRDLRMMTHSVSDRPAFIRQMNWHAGMFASRSKNQLYLRSPDAYEFESQEESFAVNLEYFLTDPEFRCRRPSVYGFYRNHFNYEPFAGQANCVLNTEVHMTGSAATVSLDPERVQEVHYLLADKGEDLSSRWGHAMFRVVLCSTKRDERGPDCIRDVMDHVIVSYRANMNDIMMDNIGGVFGKYPSQQFLLTLPEVVSEYTLGESRDVKSVPLKFSRDQIRDFIYRVLEQHWDYRGTYYFISNNCATEGKHIVMATVPGLEDRRELYVTPTGLYDQFRDWGLLDESVLSRPDAKDRYIYRGFRHQVAESFALIRQALGNPEHPTLDEYTKQLTANDRQALYHSAVKSGIAPRAKIAVQFLFMEMQIREHLKEVLKEESGRLIESAREGKALPEVEETRQAVEKSLALSQAFEPWRLATGGYGIPLTFERLPEAKLQEMRMQSYELKKAVMAAARTALGGVYGDIDLVSQNIKFFTSEIKADLGIEIKVAPLN